ASLVPSAHVGLVRHASAFPTRQTKLKLTRESTFRSHYRGRGLPCQSSWSEGTTREARFLRSRDSEPVERRFLDPDLAHPRAGPIRARRRGEPGERRRERIGKHPEASQDRQRYRSHGLAAAGLQLDREAKPPAA